MAGGDIYTLQHLLGHKSIAMTQRYAHLSPAYKVKAIDRMNNLWQRAVPIPSAPKAPPEQSPVTAVSQNTNSLDTRIA